MCFVSRVSRSLSQHRRTMARLEDLTPGASLQGILPDQLVTVVTVSWYGSDAIELTYKDASGRPDVRLIFAQMIDDPSARLELFPTEEAQEQERERLFRLIEQLVRTVTENSRTLRFDSAGFEEE